jgi:hypothetical protein
MISDKTNQQWQDRARYLVSRQHRLSSWELRFLDTVTSRLFRGGDLSWKESRKLREIFKREERQDG